MSKPSIAADHFTWASWDGAGWGQGNLDGGDLSVAAIVRNLVYTYLSEDPKLQAIFPGGRIEQMDLRNPSVFDVRQLPRLQVYLGSLRADAVATNIDRQEISIFVGVRVPIETAFKTLEPGEPSVEEIFDQVRSVLKSKKSLPAQVNGEECPLASSSEQDGALVPIADFDNAGDPRVITLELSWTFVLHVNFDSGKLSALE